MDIFGAKYELQINVEDRIRYVSDLLPYLAKVKNDVELDIYVEEIARRAKTGAQAIYAQLGKKRVVKRRAKRAKAPIFCRMPARLGRTNSKNARTSFVGACRQCEHF
ncbi:MAG: hypothetical protein L6V93_20335 [Clostridiales bacterium]|nr:MAG: hypothetical protein L6V93_20335 [Clostridiales bacterium]